MWGRGGSRPGVLSAFRASNPGDKKSKAGSGGPGRANLTSDDDWPCGRSLHTIGYSIRCTFAREVLQQDAFRLITYLPCAG